MEIKKLLSSEVFQVKFIESKDFLNKSKKLLLVIDPPYGGIVKLIANSLELIKKGCLFFFADMLIKNYTFIICKLFA